MIAIRITQSYAAPILMARAHRTHRHVVEHGLTQRGNGLFGGLSAMRRDCGGVAAFPQSNLYGKRRQRPNISDRCCLTGCGLSAFLSKPY
jgi:hypothetical protein